MSEGLQAILNDDGVFEEYDDTYDFTIHCESEEEQEEVLNKLNWRWIPVSERLPEDGIYLVTVERIAGEPRIETKSFAKNLYRVDDFAFYHKHKCGWYDYDSEYGYWEDTNVIAWMPLPQPYKAESEEVE